MKRGRRSWLGLALLLALVCSLSLTAFAAGPKISKKKATLYGTETLQLKVTGASGKVTWSSSNAKVASVSKKGKVSAKKTGTATITAKAGSKKLKCKITVKAAKLSQKSLTLQVGQSQTVTIRGGKIKSVSSSNKKVAKATKKGRITGVSVGTAKVTFKDKQGKKYVCTVKVTKAVEAETKAPETETKAAETETKAPETKPETETKAPETETKAPETETKAPETETKAPETETRAPETETRAPETETQAPETEAPRAENITASTQAELASALTANTAKITLASAAAETFVIPSGDYTDRELEVNAPNAEVINRGNFSRIVIKAIAADTFIEQAVGNTIICETSSAKIEVSEGASASLTLNQAADSTETPQITIVNDGTVSSLALNTTVNVTITETSDETSANTAIPTTVAAAAQDSKVVTSQNLTLTSVESKIDLVLQPGAEDTTAYVAADNTAVIPSVSGVGSVEIKDAESGILVDTVIAEYEETVQTSALSITGYVLQADGSAVENARLYLLPYSAAMTQSSILAAIGESEAAATTDEDGAYTLTAAVGNYYLAAAAADYKTEIQTLVLASLNQTSYVNGSITLVADGEETGSIEGTLIDSVEGSQIDYAVDLRLRAGSGNVSGTALSTMTVTDGSFVFSDLQAGTYTIQVVSSAGSDATVSTSHFSATVSAGGTTVATGTVTRALSSEQIQFVLHWGDESVGAPADLDSHLVGPDGEGGRFHTYFSYETYYNSDDELCADLDRDDTDYVGPETTTIRQRANGLYSFYVYDYSNQEDEYSTIMSNKSAAYVEVRQGDTTRAVFYIPTGQSGTLWHVCDYNAATNRIISVNTVGYWPDGGSSTVGQSVLDVLKKKLNSRIDELAALIPTLAEGTYRTNTEALLAQAREAYESSEDESELTELTQKLSAAVSEIYASASITALSSENVTYYSTDSEEAIVYAYGQADEIGEIMVEAENGSGDAVAVLVEDSAKDGYVKQITTTDAASGVVRIWYVTYEMDRSIFDILSLTGEDVISYWAYRYDSYGELHITGLTETLPAFSLELNDGVTWQLAYDEDIERDVLKLIYGSRTFDYRIDYTQETGEVLFTITRASGNGIVTYSSERGDESGILRLTGITLEEPEYYVSFMYDVVEVISSDAHTLQLQAKGRTYTYQVEYTPLESTPLTLDTPVQVVLTEDAWVKVYSFVPAETAVYELRSSDSTCDPYGELYEGTASLTSDDDGAGSSNFSIVHQLTAGVEYRFAAREYDEETGSYTITLSRYEGETEEDETEDDSWLAYLRGGLSEMIEAVSERLETMPESGYKTYAEEILAQAISCENSDDVDILASVKDSLDILLVSINASPRITFLDGENVDRWEVTEDDEIVIFGYAREDISEISVEASCDSGCDIEVTYEDIDDGTYFKRVTAVIPDTGVEKVWNVRFELTRNMFDISNVTGDSVIGYEVDTRWLEDGVLTITGTTEEMPKFEVETREGVAWMLSEDADGSPVILMTYGDGAYTYTYEVVYTYETYFFGLSTVYVEGMLEYHIEEGDASGTVYLYGLTDTVSEYYIYPKYDFVQVTCDGTTATLDANGSMYTYDIVYTPVQRTTLLLDTEEEITLSGEGAYEVFTYVPEETAVYAFRSYDNTGDPYVELYEGVNWMDKVDDDDGYNFTLTQTLKAGKTYHFVAKDFWSNNEDGAEYSVILTRVSDAEEDETEDDSWLVYLRGGLSEMIEAVSERLETMPESEYKTYAEEILAQAISCENSDDVDILASVKDSLDILLVSINASPRITSLDGENVDRWEVTEDDEIVIYGYAREDISEISVEASCDSGCDIEVTYEDIDDGTYFKRVTAVIPDTGVEKVWNVRFELTSVSDAEEDDGAAADMQAEEELFSDDLIIDEAAATDLTDADSLIVEADEAAVYEYEDGVLDDAAYGSAAASDESADTAEDGLADAVVEEIIIE